MVPPGPDLATPCSASGMSDWSTDRRTSSDRCWTVTGHMDILPSRLELELELELLVLMLLVLVQLLLRATIPWRYCNPALILDMPLRRQMRHRKRHRRRRNRRSKNGRARKPSSRSFEPTCTKPLAIPHGWIMELVTNPPFCSSFFVFASFDASAMERPSPRLRIIWLLWP